jgi:hypothetical protein
MFKFSADRHTVQPAFGPPNQIDRAAITLIEGQVILKVLQVNIYISASKAGAKTWGPVVFRVRVKTSCLSLAAARVAPFSFDRALGCSASRLHAFAVDLG